VLCITGAISEEIVATLSPRGVTLLLESQPMPQFCVDLEVIGSFLGKGAFFS
jgi:hypothetical protein